MPKFEDMPDMPVPGFEQSLHLSERLKRALEVVPMREQDRLADYLLKLFADDDAQWDTAFMQSKAGLSRLRDEALEAYRSGETIILDPEKL
jgi:hypothetical protein